MNERPDLAPPSATPDGETSSPILAVTPSERIYSKPRWWPWFEVAKEVLGVAAVLAAGAWAVMFLWFRDWDSTMRQRANTSSTIAWTSTKQLPNGGVACDAEFAVTFENISQKDIEVKHVVLQAWEFAVPSTPTDDALHATYLDLEEPSLRRRQLHRASVGRLVQTFRPGQKATEGFSFAVVGKPGQRIFVRADMWSPDECSTGDTQKAGENRCVPTSERGTWWEFVQDVICREEKKSKD